MPHSKSRPIWCPSHSPPAVRALGFAGRAGGHRFYMGGYFSKILLRAFASFFVFYSGFELIESVDTPWKTSRFRRASTRSTVSVPGTMGSTVGR